MHHFLIFLWSQHTFMFLLNYCIQTISKLWWGKSNTLSSEAILHWNTILLKLAKCSLVLSHDEISHPQAPATDKILRVNNGSSTVRHDSELYQSAVRYTKCFFALPHKLRGNFIVCLDHIHFQIFGNIQMIHTKKELSFATRTYTWNWSNNSHEVSYDLGSYT